MSNTDKSFSRGGLNFIVFRQASIMIQPGKRRSMTQRLTNTAQPGVMRSEIDIGSVHGIV